MKGWQKYVDLSTGRYNVFECKKSNFFMSAIGTGRVKTILPPLLMRRCVDVKED